MFFELFKACKKSNSCFLRFFKLAKKWNDAKIIEIIAERPCRANCILNHTLHIYWMETLKRNITLQCFWRPTTCADDFPLFSQSKKEKKLKWFQYFVLQSWFWFQKPVIIFPTFSEFWPSKFEKVFRAENSEKHEFNFLQAISFCLFVL